MRLKERRRIYAAALEKGRRKKFGPLNSCYSFLLARFLCGQTFAILGKNKGTGRARNPPEFSLSLLNCSRMLTTLADCCTSASLLSLGPPKNFYIAITHNWNPNQISSNPIQFAMMNVNNQTSCLGCWLVRAVCWLGVSYSDAAAVVAMVSWGKIASARCPKVSVAACWFGQFSSMF